MTLNLESVWYTRHSDLWTGDICYQFKLDEKINYTEDIIVDIVDKILYEIKSSLHNILSTYTDNKDYHEQVISFLGILAKSDINVEKIIFNYAEQSIEGKCLKFEVYRTQGKDTCQYYEIETLDPETKKVIGEGILVKVYGEHYI